MITITDIFAGAGGSTSGAAMIAGVEVRVAANHWQMAVDVHQINHPDTDHACVDLHLEDPRNFPTTDILWASPECFAAGTLILTERGLLEIEDVQVGDMVLTHANRWRPVTATMSKRADTLRLVGQGHTRGLEVTSDHPVLITTGGGVEEWTPVADVYLDGRSRWATPVEFPAAAIPPITGKRPVHVEDPRFAWVVGRWLGDGSLRVRPKGSDESFITCGKHEADDLEKNLTWVHHDCGTCPSELTWSRRELPTAIVYANSHSELARWLREHFGQHAHGKTVPAWALGAPREWREALLAGYLSADGHDNGRGWQAASVSKRLALGVRLLAESLGHRVGLTYSHRDTWRIQGRSGKARPQWSVQWLHEIKRESSQTATTFGGHAWGTVKDRLAGSADVVVYDLTVADDHSYVADGIVVHNCTKWSQARGKTEALSAELGGDATLFDQVPDDLMTTETDEITRSRLLMFDVLRFVEHHRYRAVVVENVVDIATQPKYASAWRLWLGGFRRLGYDLRVVSHNAMHAQAHGLPAPQSRDRLYVVAWRKGEKAPDVDAVMRPRAWCTRCDAVVESVQAWKPGRTVGKYRVQYVYACSRCGATVTPGWLPAAAAIDWTLPGQRIGDRTKPLADKTRARIAAGIARYWRPFHIEAGGHTYDAADPKHPAYGDPNAYYRAWSVDKPLKTLHTIESKALVTRHYGIKGGDPARHTTPSDQVLRTLTGNGGNMSLLTPFIAELRGGGSVARSTTRPLATVSAQGNHHALVSPYYGTADTAKPVNEALGTLTTRDRYALITRHNSSKGDGAEMTTPAAEYLRTLTTTAQQSVVTPGDMEAARAQVDDCLFRMLEPHEVAAGMAFPLDYQWLGTRRDRVKLAGNAVCPPAARDLIAAVVEALS